MADVTVKRLDEFEAIFGGGFRRVRAGLGVNSFGLAVMDLPPGFTQYPEHDTAPTGGGGLHRARRHGHADRRGGGARARAGVFARVGPQESRKITTGDDGARLLAIGASPGKVYEAPEFTEEGQPDPMSPLSCLAPHTPETAAPGSRRFRREIADRALAALVAPPLAEEVLGLRALNRARPGAVVEADKASEAPHQTGRYA